MNGPPLIIFKLTQRKYNHTFYTKFSRIGTTLQLNLNIQALLTRKHPKIFGITVYQKLILLQHINVTIIKEKEMLNILKAFISTKWCKQNKLIDFKFKAMIRRVLEYANTI